MNISIRYSSSEASTTQGAHTRREDLRIVRPTLRQQRGTSQAINSSSWRVRRFGCCVSHSFAAHASGYLRAWECIAYMPKTVTQIAPQASAFQILQQWTPRQRECPHHVPFPLGLPLPRVLLHRPGLPPAATLAEGAFARAVHLRSSLIPKSPNPHPRSTPNISGRGWPRGNSVRSPLVAAAHESPLDSSSPPIQLPRRRARLPLPPASSTGPY